MTGVARSGNEIWGSATELIKSRLANPIYRSWFEPIKPSEIVDSKLTLFVPSKFAKDWIEPRYLPLIAGAVSSAAGVDIEIELEIDSQAAPHPAASPAPESARDLKKPVLNARYTFDSYVIGASNRFAHAAALAVAEAPGRAYNPLFVYGGVGLGKTHLLHAIGQYVHETQPTSTVRYVSSEQFTNEFIASVGDPGRIAGFKRRHRGTDVLLVDDVQFFEGKEATVEEFFHTFNTLYDAGKQIVLTSDRAPKSLGLDERVHSRFEWGLITDVQPPDLETRIAILRKKAEFEGVGHLPDDVLAYMASRIESNIRELEGALIRVVAFASLDRSTVTVGLAETVLKDLYPESGPGSITAEVIISEVARYFELSVDELNSMKRDRNLVHARHIAMYLCRELTQLSLPQIGLGFGGRDHTTVMHAVRKVSKSMAEKRATYNQIQELTGRIRNRVKNL
ncbi:MAG TPA: chromosomal replication initiator protein DnaA [Actinomycetota bacterium]|nr:chromosomal replication initiator protein DnaA [Actinomycetota bacterium]